MSANERILSRDAFFDDTSMPIARATARTLQAIKPQRHTHAPSAHHVRQMAQLTATAKVIASSPPKSEAQMHRELENALVKAKRATLSSAKPTGVGSHGLRPVVARPHSSGAFRPRKLEPTRFRYFCESVHAF